MIVIKCSSCNKKVFKYLKIGKGRVLTCWNDKISKDYSVREADEKSGPNEQSPVKCVCGSVIGYEKGKGIRMIPHAFTYSGTVVSKK